MGPVGTYKLGSAFWLDWCDASGIAHTTIVGCRPGSAKDFVVVGQVLRLVEMGSVSLCPDWCSMEAMLVRQRLGGHEDTSGPALACAMSYSSGFAA